MQSSSVLSPIIFFIFVTLRWKWNVERNFTNIPRHFSEERLISRSFAQKDIRIGKGQSHGIILDTYFETGFY